jgi:hypothetical protein
VITIRRTIRCLYAHDPYPGQLLTNDSGNPGDQAAASDRNNHLRQRGAIVSDLDSHTSLTRDDVQVIKRVDEGRAALIGSRSGKLYTLINGLRRLMHHGAE